MATGPPTEGGDGFCGAAVETAANSSGKQEAKESCKSDFSIFQMRGGEGRGGEIVPG